MITSTYSGQRSRNVAQAQAPVITRCQRIHHGLIGRIDPQLWERLETEGVEAQIWAMSVVSTP
jgi:TBC1 domain family protein 5